MSLLNAIAPKNIRLIRSDGHYQVGSMKCRIVDLVRTQVIEIVLGIHGR
jgi:hypothetical protein